MLRGGRSGPQEDARESGETNARPVGGNGPSSEEFQSQNKKNALGSDGGSDDRAMDQTFTR